MVVLSTRFILKFCLVSIR